PWNSRRYWLSGSFRRIPYLSDRLMTNRLSRPTLATSRESGHSSRLSPGIFTVTLPSFSSKAPAWDGPSGRTISLSGSLPKLLEPSCSQNKPATLSQPPSRFSAASRWARHSAISDRYAVAANIAAQANVQIGILHVMLPHVISDLPRFRSTV